MYIDVFHFSKSENLAYGSGFSVYRGLGSDNLSDNLDIAAGAAEHLGLQLDSVVEIATRLLSRAA
jgi:hypothetical protein